MSDRGSIFGRLEGRFGCGYLSARDVDAYLSGWLGGESQRGFDRHLIEGCPECVHLATALEQFREILDRGPLACERRRFAGTRDALWARLRQALGSRRTAEGGKLIRLPRRPAGRPMTTAELETLAAAGSGTPTDDPASPDDEA